LAAGKNQDTGHRAESFIVSMSSRRDETTAKFRINFSTTPIQFDAKKQFVVKIVRSGFQLLDVGIPDVARSTERIIRHKYVPPCFNLACYRVSTSGHLKSHLHITDIVSLSVISLTSGVSANALVPPDDQCSAAKVS